MNGDELVAIVAVVFVEEPQDVPQLVGYLPHTVISVQTGEGEAGPAVPEMCDIAPVPDVCRTPHAVVPVAGKERRGERISYTWEMDTFSANLLEMCKGKKTCVYPETLTGSSSE